VSLPHRGRAPQGKLPGKAFMLSFPDGFVKHQRKIALQACAMFSEMALG
jgi:hypothetical protein